MKKFIAVFLLVFWMGFIFVNSHMDSTVSDKESKIVTKVAINKKNDEINSYNKIVRKCAHVTEYMVLSLLIYNVLVVFDTKKSKMIITFLGTSIYAMSDEFHQLYIPGRSGEVRDVLIDMIGFIVAILIIYVLKWLWRKKNEKRNKKC